MALKWVNIIAVRFTDETRYVTGFGEHKIAYWKDGETAKSLSMATAKDVVFGLCVNGYDAFIITAPKYTLEYYKNKENKA